MSLHKGHPQRAYSNYVANLISWPYDAGFDVRFLQGPRDIRLCIKSHLVAYNKIGRGWKDMLGDHPFRRFEWADHGAPTTDLYCLMLLSEDRDEALSIHGLVLTPVNLEERVYRRIGIVEEQHPYQGVFAPPKSSWVGEFLSNRWAPVRSQQEVYIV